MSAYWNGAATYYRGNFRALAALGHEIEFCEPDIYDRQANRDLAEDPDHVRVRVYRGEEELARLLEAACGADLVVKCSGVGARDRELEEWIAALEGPAMRAFWDVDAAHTLARVEGDPADPMRACIPLYDLVFTYGGGPPVVERYGALGARACHPVYNGLDPDVHHPVPLDTEYACDLGGDKVLPSNVRWIEHVPTAAHNAINCSARLVLNIHRDGRARTVDEVLRAAVLS